MNPPRRDTFERHRISVPIEHVPRGRRIAGAAFVFLAFENREEAFGLGIGKRPQNNGVDDAEERRIRADPDGER